MSETSPPRFASLGADAGRILPQLAEIFIDIGNHPVEGRFWYIRIVFI